MIEVNGLVKRFDGFTALDGTSVTVPAGSVYGLVGPNGAGKSTLIRHLTGIYRQDAGAVRIGGEDVMGDVSQRGTTVLVSSHNLRELEDVCDHVGIMDRGRVLLERSLAQLQDNMVKLQVVFQDGVTEVPEDLPVLHVSKTGRIHTLIMRMNAEEATAKLAAYSPLLVDAVPLTLEEIFIYELGGADYAVKDIVL